MGLPEKIHESWCEEVAEDGNSFCESMGGQDVGIAPTERLKLRRQMEAAAGKMESVSFSHSFHGSEQFGS